MTSPNSGGSSPVAILVALLGVLVFAARPATGQIAITGRVIEEGTEQPIGNVDLRLLDSAGQVVTSAISSAEGAFRMEAPSAAVYSLSVRRIGYASVRADSLDISDDDGVELEVSLNPQAVAVDAVRVIVDREPFWYREVRRRTEQNKRMGVGRIFLREDLDRINAYSVTDLLATVGWNLRCTPAVLLDGVETEARYITHQADMIEAVELYRGATQVPLEYSRYSGCGVALVWTRRNPPDAKPFTWKRLAAAGILVGIAALLVR